MEIILATPAGGRYHDNCDSGVGGLLQGYGDFSSSAKAAIY